MTCPRCAVAAFSPITGICDLCGYRLDASVAVEGVDALMDLVTKQLAHEFDIVDLVGRVHGSVVFRALETKGGRSVILKVVQRRADDPEAELRFRSTMSTFAQLDHPHLVPVLRFGTTDSLLWYATQDTGAQSLRAVLDEETRLDPRRARRIATQLVSTLEYLHRHGIVHAAVKAENVFIDKQGWAWLADPSFARTDAPPARRTSGEEKASTGERAARPTWVAPEDVSRTQRLPSSDQYALAALVFECVAGEPPLKPGEQVARFRPEVPRGMSDAIARALDPEPGRRFSSCADFLWALEEGNTVAPEPRPTGRITQDVLLIHDWTPPEEPARPNRLPLLIGGAVIVLIALALTVPSLMRRFEAARAPAVVLGVPEQSPAPATVATSAQEPAALGTPAPAPLRSTLPPSSTSSTAAITPPTTTAPRPPAAAPSVPSTRPEAPAPAEVVAPAKLFINASPWGQVFIDGVLVGNTPRTNLEVAPGEHIIRVERAGFATVTRTVRVVSGETLRITDIVLTPTSP